MSIKFAVLGLIAEEPRHGYAVRAAFEEQLGDFWELNYGQVYQVLTTLEQEGLIVGANERVGRRPTRTVYSISPKGRHALQRWLEHPVSRKQPFRDEFYLRLLFASQSNPKLIPAMLERQIRRCHERLADLTDQQVSSTPSGAPDVRNLFRHAAILSAEADLKSLLVCRDALVPGAADRTVDTRPTVRVGRAGPGS